MSFLSCLRRHRPAPPEQSQPPRLRRYTEPYEAPRGRLITYELYPPEYVPPAEPEPLPAWLASPLIWRVP